MFSCIFSYGHLQKTMHIYRICCPLCCYRGYKKCEMVPETAIWTANPFCRSTYLLMWVVPSHRTLCCFCPSYWHHLLIGGWLQNQHSAQTTHFVDAFEKHIHNGYVFRNNILCLQNKHSAQTTHFVDIFEKHTQWVHMFSETTFCAKLPLHKSIDYNLLLSLLFFHAHIPSDKEQLKDF